MSEGGPVAMITGAGRGMGAAIARELASEGYRLSLMSPSENCEKLAAELGGVAVRGNTSREADIDALFQLTMESYGRVDALVNHTGGPPKGDLLDIPDESWDMGHDLVIKSVLWACRRVTPVMEAQGKGAIVNITSFAAFEPSLVFPTSCVYRAGLGAFTKLYADRYAASGIRMNALLPGMIDSLPHGPEVAESIPMKRLGSVNEIAKTTAFLLSDGAGYITGQNIKVDGGLTQHV